MFVVDSVGRFDEGITRQRVTRDVGHVLSERRDMGDVDAEGVARISDGLLRSDGGRDRRGLHGILIEVFRRISESRERGYRISIGLSAGTTVAIFFGTTSGSKRVVDPPGDVVLIQFLKNSWNGQLRSNAVVDERIVDETLGGTSGHGGDAIGSTFAGDG